VGVIIRYLRPAADIADYDRFHAINAALTIAADQWVTLPDYLDIYSADHPKASPLDEQTAREVLAAVVRAKARLSLPGDASPAKVQQAIYEFVDTWLTSKAARKGQDATDVALELGCAWGQSVCDALGWQWRAITREGSTAYAVVSPDLACFVPPMIYLERQLTQRGRETDNTTLLLFNMLKAGETGGRPGSLRQLG
jgi:hypothetical protein